MKLVRKSGAPGDDQTTPGGQDEPVSEPTSAKPSAKAPRKGPADVARGKSGQRKGNKRGYLDGQMLIAMPSMGDERFARSVIYMCAHSSEGAMGIIVNQPASNISFPDLLVQLEVVGAADLIELPTTAGGVRVLRGGPVET